MAREEHAAIRRLSRALQNAHAGERAAANAYNGHWRSVRDPQERADIQRIEAEELDHRRQLHDMLLQLGVSPRPLREFIFNVIGRIIGGLCRVGGWMLPMFGIGWFIAMYGAGKFERANVAEYEVAARLAQRAGRQAWVHTLLHFAEVEWDHEAYFRAKVSSHPLIRVVPLWKQLPPRADIAASMRQDP